MSSAPPMTSRGRRLRPDERAARDESIGRDAAAGVPLPDLADRYGLSVKQTRRIADAWTPVEAPPALSDIDVEMLAREMRDAHHLALRTAVTLMHTGNPSIQIGAARTVTPVSAALCDLLRGVGLLLSPNEMYARVKDDQVRRFLDAVLAVAERREIPFEEIESELDREAERVRQTPALSEAGLA